MMYLLHCHKFIYIFKKNRSVKVFPNAKGDISVGTFFHYILKKIIAFLSNTAQHLWGPLELLSRKTCFNCFEKSPLNLIFCHW